MNTKDIDILNIVLIVVSLVLAFNIPFGLFIFSYVILGPLHYLTEINWLKEKKYFVKNTQWIWVFILFCSLLTIPFFMKSSVFSAFNETPAYKSVGKFLVDMTDEILLISLLFAIGLIHFKNKMHLALFFVASVLIALPAMYFLPGFALWIAIFIPTLVHVYIFTLLFMTYGTMQSKSNAGIVAIVLLIAVPFIIMISKINPNDYSGIRQYTQNSFDDSGFGFLNFKVAQFFSEIERGQFQYLSVTGIKIQIFVAFAYTYHYLNWFSKTSIIGWNKNMSRTKITTILTIWGFSIGLYLYNFKIGFIALSFLSLVHVFLEFPLNITSIKGIFLKLKRS